MKKNKGSKMKNILKATFCLIMILTLSFPLISCGGMGDSEAKAIVKELVEKSTVVNEVLYGKGMDYEKSLDGKYQTMYSRVTDDAPFKTRKALEKEIKSIFTASYANSLLNHAFTLTVGIYGNSSYPRYQEGSDEVLTVMRDYEAREITVYNFDTIVIEKATKNKIVATIMSTENEKVYVYLINELDGWRLDSATV